MGSFANQAMSAKQAKFPAGRGRTLALLCLGLWRRRVKQGLQIPVAKAVDLELTAIDGFQ
jgi:hypothetical protein